METSLEASPKFCLRSKLRLRSLIAWQKIIFFLKRPKAIFFSWSKVMCPANWMFCSRIQSLFETNTKFLQKRRGEVSSHGSKVFFPDSTIYSPGSKVSRLQIESISHELQNFTHQILNRRTCRICSLVLNKSEVGGF